MGRLRTESKCTGGHFERIQGPLLLDCLTAKLERNNTVRFVYGSSELNLLRIPFFCNGKDPLEDFDYNGPRCNPIRKPSSCKKSLSSMHTSPQAVCLTSLLLRLTVQDQISRALNCGNRCTERCEGEPRYRTLISLLGLFATMHRVVNYHSSWARQQQVELFDASGNLGFTAGRGFNPAGGAPGGG
ncbi:putative leucine-rich repeat receptor-like protein kinase [Dorcoceras hygrometricum]|uniref:Putative leucine-rich repeat receptor-like protein kinase n=1 Tax=Dorcoceras hygrometricum TaxID=472368 RepID=A0A2Z7C250_9LAMI|nr:putative leucine-rich repeat receptor-like protein kinase [Dorcoceras hygrometricum]